MRSLAPWAGWIGGIAGWFLSHQLGSYAVQLDCSRVLPVLLVGLFGAALAVTSGIASWRVWHGSGEAGIETRKFIAATAALAALVFLLAILFQTLSAFVIPKCYG